MQRSGADVDRYAVVGNPVGHSLSPQLHAFFAEQTGQQLSYGRLEPEPQDFLATVEDFFHGGGAGLNVTVPFKGEACDCAVALDAAAERAAAVNTLLLRERHRPRAGLQGCNTDGPGLLADLETQFGLALEGMRILLLGAGGAARGVLQPLLDRRPQRLTVANRSLDRARSLAEAGLFDVAAGTRLDCSRLDGLPDRYDLVLHATAAGLGGEVPALPPTAIRDAFCYDLSYGGATPFVRWAREHGAREAADGLGMLVEQGALAFELWRGVRPPTVPARHYLRSLLERS